MKRVVVTFDDLSQMEAVVDDADARRLAERVKNGRMPPCKIFEVLDALGRDTAAGQCTAEPEPHGDEEGILPR